ncbi:MAG: hypothetical protein Fur0024_2590 [Patescibacteria group bacterium]
MFFEYTPEKIKNKPIKKLKSKNPYSSESLFLIREKFEIKKIAMIDEIVIIMLCARESKFHSIKILDLKIPQTAKNKIPEIIVP